MPELETRDKIIFALVRNNTGQTFTELLQRIRPKTNHDSLSRGLKVLKKEKIIKNENGLYYFSTEIKNPILLSLKGSYTVVKRLDGFVEKIKKLENPFPLSYEMLSRIIELQIMLKLERYTTPKLTKREKLEFDLFTDIFDVTIESIFETLLKKNLRQTQNLKAVLTKIIVTPTLQTPLATKL